MSFTSEEKIKQYISEIKLQTSPLLTKEVTNDFIWREISDTLLYILHNFGKDEELVQIARERLKTSEFFEEMEVEGDTVMGVIDMLIHVKPFSTIVSSKEGFSFDKKTVRNIQRLTHENYYGKDCLKPAQERSLDNNIDIVISNVVNGSQKEVNVLANGHKRIIFIMTDLLNLVDLSEFKKLKMKLFPTKFKINNKGDKSEKDFTTLVNSYDRASDSKSSTDVLGESTYIDNLMGCYFKGQAEHILKEAKTSETTRKAEETITAALSHGLLQNVKTLEFAPSIEKELLEKAAKVSEETGGKKKFTEKTLYQTQKGMITKILLACRGKKSPKVSINRICNMLFATKATPDQLKYRQRVVEIRSGIYSGFGSKSLGQDYEALFQAVSNNTKFDVYEGDDDSE